MNKPGTLAFMFVLFSSVFLFAQYTQTNSEIPDWVLAACAFTAEKTSPGFENTEPEHTDKTAEVLPKLILEKAAEAGMRNVTAEELLRREKKTLTVQRRSLYAELEKKTNERDILIASGSNEKKLRLDIEAKEKEIQAVAAELEKNTGNEAKLSLDLFNPVKERITVWKREEAALYPPVKPSAFSQEPSDIRGLITGSIYRAGSYIHVHMQLLLYPGAVRALQISETENFDNLEALADRLAAQLISALCSTKEARLLFDIQPDEAAAKAVMRLDGRLLHFESADPVQGSASVRSDLTADGTIAGKNLFSANISGGIHELYVEADSFEASSFVYDFSAGGDFYVQVRLQKRQRIPVKISVPDGLPYTLFINGLEIFPVRKTKDIFTVNGFPVLAELSAGGKSGHFILEGKNKNDVYLSEYRLLKTETYTAVIEKKRKLMYNSYAALIVSLPVTFALLGKQVDEYNSWARGNNISDDLQKWTTAAYTASGISIGLGINFFVQLGLYLHSVNKVLPEQIKPAKF